MVGPGGAARAHFEADGDVQWDMHTHAGQDIRVLSQGIGRAGDIPFDSPAGGLYSFAWYNRASAPIAVDVQITVTGDVAFHSWVP